MRWMFALSFLILIQSAQSQADKIRFDVPKEILVGQTFELGIHFSLTSVAGMARLQLDFPKGFEVQESKNSGALFTYSANLLQLLWVQLPSTDSIHCSVRVQCLPGYGGKAEIPARFYYLENGARKEIVLNTCKLIISGEAGKRFTPMKRDEVKPVTPSISKTGKQTSGTPSKSEEKPSSAPKSIAVSEKTGPKKGAEQKDGKASASESEKIEHINSATGDKVVANEKATDKQSERAEKSGNTPPKCITFRIQLAASSEKSLPEALAKRYNVKPEEIAEEFHNGMYKYTVGNFNNLAGAREAMGKNEAMKTGCFIAGYENGTRIALEDAIRLSKK